jgi:hypothetical protein
VRLYSRPGNDLTRRFPLIVDVLSRLRGNPVGRDGCIRQELEAAIKKSPERAGALGFDRGT